MDSSALMQAARRASRPRRFNFVAALQTASDFSFRETLPLLMRAARRASRPRFLVSVASLQNRLHSIVVGWTHLPWCRRLGAL